MYSLYAVVGRTNDLETKPIAFAHARCVRLGGGLSMVPLSEALLSEIQGKGASPGGASVSGAFEFLSSGVEAWLQSLSREAETAYVETEYLGGEGFERAAVWSHGLIALGPLDGAGSINQALRAMGVEAPPGQEEFELVGLGRHRSLEEWIQDAG